MEKWLRRHEAGYTAPTTQGVWQRADRARTGNARWLKNRAKRKARERKARWQQRHRTVYNKKMRQWRRRKRLARIGGGSENGNERRSKVVA
jgi:hypothetical protein